VFGVATAAVLIADLERPERFYYILIRPNWRSWMVWGAYFLTAHGAIATFWLLAAWLGADAFLSWLVVPAIVASILATSYTGFLFAQGLARDLWQGPYAAVDLLAQAAAAGAATLIIAVRFVPGIDPAATVFLVRVLAVAVSAHLVFLAFEMLLAPSPSVHHELAVSTIRRGPYARLFWGLAVAGGGLLPLALLLASPSLAAATTVAAVLALAGGFAWEYIWVEAGQSVPLS
jgi:formate-dependent nitrite reductase membrane component NrfD